MPEAWQKPSEVVFVGVAMDSLTSACEEFPEECIQEGGILLPEKAVHLRLVRPPSPLPPSAVKPGLWTRMAVGLGLVSIHDTGSRPAPTPYTEAMKARVEKALAECADQARTDVLLRRTGGRSPTPDECRETVAVDSQGNPVTRAMQFGEEMHRVAFPCAEEALSKLRPGGYTIEPRYLYNRATGEVTYLSPEEEATLLSQGRGRELLGSLVPDIAIHDANPLPVLDVFDFKFPCVNIDQAW